MTKMFDAICSESEITKLFKDEVFAEGLGKGEWKKDVRGYKILLDDGKSYIKIAFFDTVKQITNSKLVPIAGRESFLSYINVSVMPAGVKGYSFVLDVKQYPWAHAKARAADSHAISIENLKEKASEIGIDLEQPEGFETYYVGKM